MMKRIRENKPASSPTAILTADWHIRPTVPVCRTDDFIAAMWKKVEFILDLSVRYKVPVLMAGDIGLKSQWPNWLLEEFIRRWRKYPGFPTYIFFIPGQHDLPNHQLDQWRQSAVGVLESAGILTVLGAPRDRPEMLVPDVMMKLGSIFPFPYGIEIKNVDQPDDHERPLVAVAHALVTERAPEKFLEEYGACSAMSLLEGFLEYDLILTGDNHKPFVVEYEGRLLVNPGSLMRTTADQTDHKPRVYLWYSLENRIEPVYLPIEEDVIDRTHIDLQEAKDERIEAYVSRLSEEVEIGLSFEENLESYFRTNRVRKSVQDKVWQALK
jgi:DNA repair exonuclease SbcCD nuclease subunit